MRIGLIMNVKSFSSKGLYKLLLPITLVFGLQFAINLFRWGGSDGLFIVCFYCLFCLGLILVYANSIVVDFRTVALKYCSPFKKRRTLVLDSIRQVDIRLASVGAGGVVITVWTQKDEALKIRLFCSMSYIEQLEEALIDKKVKVERLGNW